MELQSLLGLNPFPASRWGPADKPVCVLDGVVHRIKETSGPLRGSAAYVVGVTERDFAGLCQRLDVESLHCYEMRVASLQPLARLQRLRGLAIVWNTKLSDIGPLGQIQALTALRLSHTPRVFDLEPISRLADLSFLELSGGVWQRCRVASLRPIGQLPRLRELVLMNLSVQSEGLRPIAECHSLLRLDVSNQFPTDEYALLSVVLPQTECDMFAPYVRLPEPLEGKDVMVVGKGKPLLCNASDGARLARYVAQFEALREAHRRARAGE